jgi:hypothetical protein
MSRRQPPQVEERIRELARKNPGWTPSQIAIFLQGERLKVTSEDVRRALARPAATAVPGDPDAATAARPQYSAPREERTRSALPIGLLFGVLLSVLYFGVQALSPSLGPTLTQTLLLLGSGLLLLASGAVASRRFASGVRAGATAALVNLLITLGVVAVLYSALRAQLQAALGQSLPTLSDVGGWGGVVFGLATLLIIFGIFGALLGWLGARLFGRRRRRATFG